MTRRPVDRMFAPVVRDLAAQERARADDVKERARRAMESEARLDAPVTRREPLEAIEYAMSTCGGPERSMLRDLKEALS